MKKTTILFLISILIVSSCKKEDDFTTNETKMYLVSNVFDYQDRLLANYIYNENKQLIKRIFTDPTTGGSSDLLFYYSNNKVSEIDYLDHNFPGFNHTIFLFYDTHNRIKRSEISKNGSIISHINYEYASSGQITHLYKDDGTSYNFFEYDNSGNIITVTNCCSFDPITGERTEIIRRFNYDNHKKPPFNLDYLFQIELLPKMGNAEVFERNISSNNITYFENAGTKWTYEFNEDDLPTSILTEWEGLDTEEPMLLKLEYIEIEE